MLPRLLFVLAILCVSLKAAPYITCPDSCSCQFQESVANRAEIRCTSLEFLTSLRPNQMESIVSVNVTGAGLKQIQRKLEYLNNLEVLDLSRNKIEGAVTFSQFPRLKYLNLAENGIKNLKGMPKNLEYLDISSNLITQLSDDLTKIVNLKKVNFDKNPLDCNCRSISVYRKLLEKHIQFETPLRCVIPVTLETKDMKQINCSMIPEDALDYMMNDAPSLKNEDTSKSDEDVDPYSDDREYIAAENIDNIVDEESRQNYEPEGSGEGSGAGAGAVAVAPGVFDEEEVLVACQTNCSTPSPVGIHDEDNAVDSIDIIESSKILFEDILGKSETNDKPKPVEETIQKHTTNSLSHVPMQKENYVNEKDTEVSEENKDTVPDDMERAMISGNSKDSNVTYYVIGGLFVVFIALFIAVVMRKRGRRNMRNKAHVQANRHYDEVKPLKPNETRTPSDEKTSPRTIENTPLIPGENGKMIDNNTQTSLAEEERGSQLNMTPDNSASPNKNEESQKLDTLKVTIKASEIPDSQRRTPLLVHRQLTEDGNYTTTLQSTP